MDTAIRTTARALAAAVWLAASAGAVAQPLVTLADLARVFADSRAMQREEGAALPDRGITSIYRAGRFDGYLAAALDQLRLAGEVCFEACPCELRERLDESLARALADPALDRSLPAWPWLAAWLRAAYPCEAR